MTTTTEVSALERVDSIINMLDDICDHMDGFSSAEEAWLSSITETLRTRRYVMRVALCHAGNLRKPGRQQRRLGYSFLFRQHRPISDIDHGWRLSQRGS